MRKPFYILMLMLFAISACCKKPVHTPENEKIDTEIIFDWTAKNEADKVPNEMTLLIYSSGADLPIRQEVSSDRTVVNLPNGTYKIVAVNTDSKQAALRGEDKYETAEMYAIGEQRSSNILPNIDKVIYAANAGEEGFTINETNITLTMKPQSIVQKITFEIIVEMDKEIESCSAVLSGISPAVKLSTLQPIRENSGIIPLDFTVTGSEMEGKATVFGVNPDVAGAEKVPNKLLLDLSFTDGSQSVVPIDVTEAMNHILDHKITVSIKVQSNNALELIGSVTKWESGGESNVPVEQ